MNELIDMLQKKHDGCMEEAAARQQKRWEQAWQMLMPILWAVVLLEIAATVAIGVAALL